MSYNMNIQKGHGKNAVLQVGYVGMELRRLVDDYGNSDFDIRRNFSGYMVYDIPGWWGPRSLTQGWEITGKMQFHTGLPFSVFARYDTRGTGENNIRGDQVGHPNAGVNRLQAQGQPVPWIAAFVNPAQGSFGTVARNSLMGPGYGHVDLAFLKNIPIRERVHAQRRVEPFNIFNPVNLAPPSARIGSGLGQSGDTIGDYNASPVIGTGEPFNTQLALKIIF
jgi:hypothetical protein